MLTLSNVVGGAAYATNDTASVALAEPVTNSTYASIDLLAVTLMAPQVCSEDPAEVVAPLASMQARRGMS